VQKHTLGEVGN